MTADTSFKQKRFKVGLTGGIACGKSSIATLFKNLGITVVDADEAARTVVEKGQKALDEIVLCFGDRILNDDGTLNRRALREIVFTTGNEDKLEALNKIMSSHIKERMLYEIDMASSPYVIVMIPLLFEHHLEYLVDRILVVDIEYDLQLQRLVNRDNIDIELAKNMIAKQVDRATRIAKADDLIKSDNSPLDKKLNVVLKLHSLYLEIAENKLR